MFPKLRRGRESSQATQDEVDRLVVSQGKDKDGLNRGYTKDGVTQSTLSHSMTHKSAISSYDLGLRPGWHGGLQKSKERSQDRRLDPLGITVLHEPDTTPLADIVFVHGLGGTSRQTWSKNRDPNLFWPLEWLPFEPGISDARISTFGYNAQFTSSSEPSNILNISDFAKDLLFQLRFATGRDEKPLDVGANPLIFVAHSMGGLIVKKAAILGQHDVHYKKLADGLSAIVFLSTPHRGSNLADVLNKILSACLFGVSPKQYIAELKNNSPTIQEINEQFRNLAPQMDIVSFFETRLTTVGPSSMLILQRDSSTLGYPGEISKPLNADHHDVCKFTSRQDADYASVRDILKYLVQKARPSVVTIPAQTNVEELEMISNFLGNPDPPNDDHEFFAEKRLDGSCEWLLDDSELLSWFESAEMKPQVLWCTGKPGSGKSVTASYLVETFRDQGLPTVYYFFRFGDQVKNNLTSFLLSTAFQIAESVPEYRRRLLRMCENGLNLQKSAPRLIWQKLFVGALCKVSSMQPVFWVIDAIDEADAGPLLIKMLADIAATSLPLRILLVSRPTQSLSAGVERLSKRIQVEQISIDNAANDLKLYVSGEMESMRGDSAFKEKIVTRILEKADGNFLWVHLVVNEILHCHTEDAVEQALDQVPEDLELVYERMDESLALSSKPHDRDLGLAILTWTACARYSLTLSELSGALQPEYPRVLDLKHTVQQVCGEFVVIDKKLHVAMIHSSARDYLMSNSNLNFHIQSGVAHQAIFSKCLKALMASNPKGKAEIARGQSFLFYAMTSWPFHLESSRNCMDQSSIHTLSNFFRHVSVLHWIYLLASSQRLRTLIQAARALTNLLKASDQLDRERSPLTHRLQDKEILTQWGQDLVRVVGKFGTRLVNHPKAIYSLVPAFCPSSSIIRNQFLKTSGRSVPHLKGSLYSHWDDCLARFSPPGESMPLKVITIDRHFAIVTANGSVVLYYTATCEEARQFQHGERILAVGFNLAGDKMATYGFLRTKVWDTRTSKQLCSIRNPERAKALAIAFDENTETMFTCSDDRRLRVCTLAAPQNGWEAFGEPLVYDHDGLKSANSPRAVEFNSDASMVAVAYRGMHLSVWTIDERGPQFISQCERRSDRVLGLSRFQSNHTDAQNFCWNSLTGHLVGIFNDGYVFKWHPFDNDYECSPVRATNLQCSADGKFFVTTSGNGVLRVWDFYHFTPIYQLSYAASVTDLAIDTNECRIYDLRERFCNVWEPVALLRLLEADEKGSDTISARESSTQVSLFSEGCVENTEPVTALALSLTDGSYAVGDDAGMLSIFDKDGCRQAELTERFMMIDHVCWSRDVARICSADLSRTIMIEQLFDTGKPHCPKSSSTLLVVNEKDQILQLEMDAAGSFLLVVIEGFLKLWSVEQKSLASVLPDQRRRKWCNHPTEPNLLLGFASDSIKLGEWSQTPNFQETRLLLEEIPGRTEENLSSELKRRPSTTYPMSPSEIEETVDKAIISGDGNRALLQVSKGTYQGRREKYFTILDLSKITAEGDNVDVGAHDVPEPLRAELEMLIGFITIDLSNTHPRRSQTTTTDSHRTRQQPVSRNTESHRLVFLSKDYWVCSYDFDEGALGKVRRHFFLPQDWLNMDMLALAVVTNDGDLLCPRNGQVVIIADGLMEEWID